MPTVPNLSRRVTYDLPWSDGRKLRFHSIGALAMLKLEAVADRLVGALKALVRGDDDGRPPAVVEAEQLRAVIDVFKVAGEDPHLVGYLILDALRDEEWNTTARGVSGPTPQAIDEFLAAIDGAALAEFVVALARVNMAALLPLVERLAGTVPGQPAPPSPTPGGAASRT